jgi:hypothetical protein
MSPLPMGMDPEALVLGLVHTTSYAEGHPAGGLLAEAGM